MDTFNYGNYNSSISDIAFSDTNGYSGPTSELETRKQLSYPLKEIKDYLNGIKSYLDDIGKQIYPVGSIYMSVNSTDPSNLFPGTTWVALQDRFLIGAGGLYSVNSIGGEASHTLTVDEIPSHSHNRGTIVSNATVDNPGNYLGSSSTDVFYTNKSGGYSADNAGTWSTGGGESHNNMPPYIAVYMWRRTA